MTDFKLAIRGDLQKTLASRQNAYLNGLLAGSKEAANLTKAALRRDVLAAGLGKRVSNTMRGDVYPKSGRSFYPTVLIYSKAPHITAAHADGPTVRPEFSDFMPIPIDGSPADGLRRRRGETLIDAFWRRYGKDSLRLIKRKNGAYQMVARLRANVAGTRFTGVRSTRRKDGTQYTRLARISSVPVFTLVKSVRHRRRLNSRQIMAKAQRRHPARLAYHIQQQMTRSEEATAIR